MADFLLPGDPRWEFLFGRINYERTSHIPYRSGEFRLRRVRELLARLGDPHRGLAIAHVAGTKGKGSTSALLAGMLTAAGHRVGLYTSPHLEHVEERVAIDGVACSGAEFAALVDQVRPHVEAQDAAASDSAGSEGAARAPTFFEIVTAMAFLHFRQRQVDAVVLEVGLGGRLDSTNVCEPRVCVITNISFDHTKVLGNTLAAIAREKAGIIKPGVPVVSGAVVPEPYQVIARRAQRLGCRLLTLGVDFGHAPAGAAQADGANNADPPPGGQADQGASAPEPARFDYWQTGPAPRTLADLRTGLLGQHQIDNAALALAALDCLREQGFGVDEAAIRRGLWDARCPGRVEIVGRRPTVVLDVAHNVASVEALARALDRHFPPGPRVLAIAVSKDKDARGMLRLLLPVFERVVFTKFVHNPRAVEPEALLALANELAGELVLPERRLWAARPDPAAAWAQVRDWATPDHLACVTGSFFLAAEARPLIEASASAETGVSAAGEIARS